MRHRSSPPRPTGPRRAVRTLLLAIGLGLILLVAAPPAAGAQEAAPGPPRTWTLKPASADGPDARAHVVEDVAPGQTIPDHVSVTNFGDEDLHLEVYASDAFTTEAGGFDLLPRGTAPVDVGSWIRVDMPVVDLAPGQTVVIPITINVPRNATPGDHVGGIVAALTTSAASADGQQVAVESRVGTRVYLRVEGDAAPRLDIIDLTSDFQGTLNPTGKGSADVTFTLVNSGNVRLSGSQVVEVTGPFGAELGTVTLEDLPEMLPGARLVQAAHLDGIWPAGRITGTVTVRPVDPTEALEIEPVTGSSASWAVPWAQLVLLVAAMVAVTVWRRRHRRPRTGRAAPSSDPLAVIVPSDAPAPAAASSGTAGTDPRSS